MRRVAADSDVHWVMMHSLTVPVEKNVLLAREEDPVSFLLQWGETQLRELQKAGVPAGESHLRSGLGVRKNGRTALGDSQRNYAFS